MSKIDILNIDDELMYAIRNNITDPSGRGTNSTQVIAGSGATTYVLADAGINNIRSILIDTGTQSFGKDYTVVANDTKISAVTFSAAVLTGSSITVNYHKNGTWVYPDTPRGDMKLANYPRIAITDVSTEINMEFDLGAASSMSSKLKQIQVIGADEKKVTDIINDIKDFVQDNKKAFYYNPLIVAVNISPVTTWGENGSTEIVQQSITVEMPYIYER